MLVGPFECPLPTKRVQWRRELGEVRNEPVVVVHECSKGQRLFVGLRTVPVSDCGHLLRVAFNPFVRHNMPKKTSLLLKEGTLAGLQFEVSASDTIEDPRQAVHDLSRCRAKHDDVIQVSKGYAILHPFQDFVHEFLKGGWSTRNAKRHTGVFPETRRHVRCCKRGLRNRFFRQSHLMVPLEKVQSAKVARATEGVERIIDTRQHVRRFVNRFAVQLTIIDAHAPSIVFLPNEQYVRRVVAVRRSHDADLS